MKKLLLIFTFLLVFPLKAFASCEDFTRVSLSNGSISVTYRYNNDTEGTVTSQSGSVLTPNDTESISRLSKGVFTTFDKDYLILQGSLEFLAIGDLNNNPNSPLLSNISSPTIYFQDNSTEQSYCEILGFSNNPEGNTYIGEYNAPTTNLTPQLSSYNFTLKCHRDPSFPTSRVTYRLNFIFNFNTFSSDGYTLNTPYRVNVNFWSYALNIEDTCTNEQIIETIDSINDSITDLNGSITDTDTSNSQAELESQLEDWGVNYHGVAGFVTAPLSFISSLANQQACTPIPLPPILGNTSTFVLPCFMEEFEDRFPSLFTIYQIAIYFFVCYRIGIDCFKLIQKLKDPLNDEISVADI